MPKILNHIKNREYGVEKVLTLFFFIMIISNVARIIGNSSDYYPFYDETHSYFSSAVNYFENEQYNILNKESFVKSFGQPPLFQIMVWTYAKLAHKDHQLLRFFIFITNILGLIVLFYLLAKITKSYLVGMLFLYFSSYNFEIFLSLNQIYPDLLSGILSVLVLYSLNQKKYLHTFILSWLLGLFRLTSVLLIPIVIFILLRNIKEESNKKEHLYLIFSLFGLAFWMFVTKVFYSDLGSVLVMSGAVNSFEMLWNQFLDLIESHFNNIPFYLFIISFVFYCVKWHSFKLNLYLVCSIIFLVSSSAYWLGLYRYFIPGFILLIFGILVQVEKKNATKVNSVIISFLILLSISHFNTQYLTKYEDHFTNQKRANSYVSLLKSFLKNRNSQVNYIVNNEVYNLCEVMNYFDGPYNCYQLKGIIPFHMTSDRVKLDSNNRILFVLHKYQSNEEYLSTEHSLSTFYKKFSHKIYSNEFYDLYEFYNE